MPALLVAVLAALRSFARSRLELEAEILALRHQLAVLQRQTPTRPRLGRADRWLWVLLSRLWPNWRGAIQIVTPRHRRALASSRLRPLLGVEVTAATGGPAASGCRHPGANPADARRQPSLGAPRIHGELQKLGLKLSETTVAKYLGRRRPPPSPTWRSFLANHAAQLASVDFFTVPTATLRVLFVFLVLSHDRRRIVHFNVTAQPTAAWTAQQLREAWPWDTAPRFLVRDRDAIYGLAFQRVAQGMDIDDVLTAPRAPWQNPFVERVIGSLRRECLDHVIVWNERSLRRHLQQYLAYYHEWRTHLSLDKDAPVPRAGQPPTDGTIVQVPHLGGLHHHYERRAA
jgi:putative transposase